MADLLQSAECCPYQKLIRNESIELIKLWRIGCRSNVCSLLSLLASLQSCFRTRAVLHAELLALRHQLLVLQRSRRDRRPRLQIWDRALWVCLSQLWPGWRSALLIVKPETVIAWHRRGFRLYWKWKSRMGPGRPRVLSEVRELIRKISLANPRWGAPRIHGELLKLGIEVSQSDRRQVHVAVRLCSPFPCSPTPCPLRRYSKSDRGMGCPTTLGRLPVGQCAALFAARSRWQLRREIP